MTDQPNDAVSAQQKAQEAQARQQRKMQEALGALMMNQIALADQLDQAGEENARLKAQIAAFQTPAS